MYRTVWKSEKFSLTKKKKRKIRQINSSNFFSKNITFTKFLPKMCETKAQQFPHCVPLTMWWELQKFSLTPFSQKNRESNLFTKQDSKESS